MATVKFLHLTFAALSISGFLLRGIWAMTGSPALRRRVTRVLPHVNDTLLLLTGVWMVVYTAQYPLEQPWLTAKLLALLLYIALGVMALRLLQGHAARMLTLLGALLVYVYMVSVALTRSPLPGYPA